VREATTTAYYKSLGSIQRVSIVPEDGILYLVINTHSKLDERRSGKSCGRACRSGVTMIGHHADQ